MKTMYKLSIVLFLLSLSFILFNGFLIIENASNTYAKIFIEHSNKMNMAFNIVFCERYLFFSSMAISLLLLLAWSLISRADQVAGRSLVSVLLALSLLLFAGGLISLAFSDLRTFKGPLLEIKR